MLYAAYGSGPGSLLRILLDLQKRYRFVPAAALSELARISPWSLADLVGFVTSFEDFSLKPVGRHVVAVCDGTACHAAGSIDVVRALEDKLGVSCGKTTPDGELTLKTVHCVGACSLAPVVLTDEATHGRVRISRLDDVTVDLQKDTRDHE